MLDHRLDEESFGRVLRVLLFHKRLQQVVVFSLAFAGQDAEGVGIVVEAVRGPDLENGSFAGGRDRPGAALRVRAICVRLFLGRQLIAPIERGEGLDS